MSRLFLVLCLFAGSCGCGGAGKAGDPCMPMADAAGQCASGVCLAKVPCPGGRTVSVCAGTECTGPRVCTEAGQDCVHIDGTGRFFCLPAAAECP